jgi:hypothetical protein
MPLPQLPINFSTEGLHKILVRAHGFCGELPRLSHESVIVEPKHGKWADFSMITLGLPSEVSIIVMWSTTMGVSRFVCFKSEAELLGCL